ncbi:hypothetical protein [Tardiphaga sp.]|uniref:hypothetical protein n=1 Tax=Tardiphaga sp. TaxID=1926292 RepID=UPI002623C320|nr:hypothetical protein [Tardiphaga sp.]MDB5618424.1 hypothetical protein [Tardiphaga sp.]
MPDILKMDELLAIHEQTRGARRPASVRPTRNTAVMKWSLIGLGTMFYAVPALGMIGYAFWVAANLNK